MTLARALFASAAWLSLAACGAPQDVAEADGEPEQPSAETEAADTSAAEGGTAEMRIGPEPGTLAWATSGDWRGDRAARDPWRNPSETLDFFDVDPSGVVVEIWPAGGWYADILAPWVASNDGTYVAAWWPVDPDDERGVAFRERFLARMDQPTHGEIALAEMGPETGPIVEPGAADAVLTFRNVHSWMARGWAEKAFADFHAALKPGGVLGVVEHRLPATRVQDPRASTGYVQEDYVIALAEEAGFILDASSEINANPDDDADHPFGVWTLAPVARTAPPGEPEDPDFNRAPYDRIGESDRMTLRFIKPLPDQAAPDPDAPDPDGNGSEDEA